MQHVVCHVLQMYRSSINVEITVIYSFISVTETINPMKERRKPEHPENLIQ